MSQEYRMEELELSLIVFDKELQVRVENDQETIHDYYEAMETEEDVKKFPPPTVYFDGCHHWLADGHHRYWAAHRRGYQKMLVRVVNGSHDDAILAAVKLNSKNGLRFKDSDWEKIVPLITSKEQWKDWSNRKLAEELNCSYETIRRHRLDSGDTCVSPEKRQGKDGKMYKVTKKPTTVSGDTCVSTEKKSATPSPNETVPVETDVTQPHRDEKPAPDNALAEAERIFDMVTTLEKQITQWFDSAPPEMHEDFAERLRKRIAAIID